MPAFHLSLPIADLSAAEGYYERVLGGELGRHGPDWVDVNLYGHQLSLHEVPGYVPDPTTCKVDGTDVPVRHFGLILSPGAWREMVDRLVEAGTDFLLTPRSRFVGEVGEQHTMFVADPSGNAIEFKAFPKGVWT